MLDEQGWLDDIPKVSWEDGGTGSDTWSFDVHVYNLHRLHIVHPSLQFISHVPLSVTGEQLMNQFLRCIPDRTWLFKYGRVPLNLVMGQWLWQVSPRIPSNLMFYPVLRTSCASLCFLFVLQFVGSCFFALTPERGYGLDPITHRMKHNRVVNVPFSLGPTFRSFCRPLAPQGRFELNGTRGDYSCAHIPICSWVVSTSGGSQGTRHLSNRESDEGDKIYPICAR